MDSSLFAAVFELAPAAMIMVNARGSIVLINREAERLFGYERNDLVGQPIEKLVPERYRHHHPEMRNGYLGRPEARRMGVGRELHALRRDGVEVPVEIGLNPINFDSGTLVLSAIVDISERQRLEATRRANEALEQRVRERTAELEDQTERLRLSNQALERSNIELQQFAYVASHDLQSPLRSISSFVQLIERRCVDQVDDQGKAWIRSTADATQRLSTLIRDLLEVSRVDSRAQNFQPVALDEILADACNLLRDTLDDAHAVLESDPLPTVLGDRSQLVQLFQNLIGNAVKYCGAEPPNVHISARRAGHEWQIRVRDQGIGISPDQHERVFEIFKRLHTQKAYPGTGIGLAVCRRVVTRHGGRIWIESEQPKGSTFVFTLMADEEPVDDSHKATLRAPDSGG
jgi:PAS domain S-box-containing protein